MMWDKYKPDFLKFSTLVSAQKSGNICIIMDKFVGNAHK
jgi:hypothetical protein